MMMMMMAAIHDTHGIFWSQTEFDERKMKPAANFMITSPFVYFEINSIETGKNRLKQHFCGIFFE